VTEPKPEGWDIRFRPVDTLVALKLVCRRVLLMVPTDAVGQSETVGSVAGWAFCAGRWVGQVWRVFRVMRVSHQSDTSDNRWRRQVKSHDRVPFGILGSRNGISEFAAEAHTSKAANPLPVVGEIVARWSPDSVLGGLARLDDRATSGHLGHLGRNSRICR
jgi:hypothetical protein